MGPTVLCYNCLEEKGICNELLGGLNGLCSDCKSERLLSQIQEAADIFERERVLCFLCLKEKLVKHYEMWSLVLDYPICKGCVSGQNEKKICQQCNIAKTKNHFIDSEWKGKSPQCKDCCLSLPRDEKKTCQNCNEDKTEDQFSKKQWKKKSSRCKVCIIHQNEKKTCRQCKEMRDLKYFSKKQKKKESPICNNCQSRPQKKTCQKCKEDKAQYQFSKNQWNKESPKCKSCIKTLSDQL